MKTIQNKEDYNNELGKAFEKHAAILLSKTLDRKDNLYFNINFDIIDAIKTIKSKLLQNIPIDNESDNVDKEEILIYKNIKELVHICNCYLKKVLESAPKTKPEDNQKKNLQRKSWKFWS